MTVEQFLSQFHFASMSESRRFVTQGAVKINQTILKPSDMIRQAKDVLKEGDTIVIGKHKTYRVSKDHLE